jgi:hypothetical protein
LAELGELAREQEVALALGLAGDRRELLDDQVEVNRRGD